MNFHLKMILILLLTVILPILLAGLGGCFVEDEYFLYGYICSPGSFTILNLTPILGSLFSLFLNFKQKKSIFWYLINGIVFILISLNILTLLSISNMKLL